MKIDNFVDRLDEVRPSGDGFSARCPAHDDRTPSLSVTEGKDGRILLHCHNGCEAEDIVSAIGLEMKDLFSSSIGNETKAPKKRTSLEPIDSALIEQQQRQLSPEMRAYLKTHRALSDVVINKYQLGAEVGQGEQRLTIPILNERGECVDIRRWLPPEKRRDGIQKIYHWKTGYGDSRLYPIDQLEYDDLLFTEGELDALAAISHGIWAITLTAGVNTDLPSSIAHKFRGKRITILMDNDNDGRKGGAKRAETLARCGADVRIAIWPEDRPGKWDITDELK